MNRKDILKMCIQNLKRRRSRTLLTLLGVLIAAALIAVVVPGAVINDFGFLSMGLRAAVVFFPLTCALAFPGRIDRRWALASICSGPLAVLLASLAKLSFDPLFAGMAVSLLLMLLGAFLHPKRQSL